MSWLGTSIPGTEHAVAKVCVLICAGLAGGMIAGVLILLIEATS